MKKIIVVLIIFFGVFNIQAQIDLGFSQDSTVHVKKVYAGLYSGTFFNLDSLNSQSDITLRIGAAVDYKIFKNLTVESFAVYEKQADKNIFITMFGLKYNFGKKSFLRIGKIPTPATLFRPHPVSGNAQFESWTTSQLPGANIGMMYHINNTNIGMYDGVDGIEFHISQKIFNFNFGLWRSNRIRGYVLSYKKNKISTTLFYKKRFGSKTFDSTTGQTLINDPGEKLIGNLFVYSPRKDLSFYSDIGYFPENDTFPRLQIGVLKNVHVNLDDLNVLVGGAWDKKTNSLVGYLQVNL